MNLIVNGKKERLAKKMSLLEFLKLKKQNPNMVVLEYNKKIVAKESWSNIILKDNDKLEILKFVGGGSYGES